jgi:hypothetical protein
MNVGNYNIPGYIDKNMAKTMGELHEQVENTQGGPHEQVGNAQQTGCQKIVNTDLKVVGVTFPNADGSSRREIITSMVGDERIDLVREPNNQYDPNAIKILANDKQIGYIGRDYASIMAPLMDGGIGFTAVVKGCGEYKGRPYCEITINQL